MRRSAQWRERSRVRRCAPASRTGQAGSCPPRRASPLARDGVEMRGVQRVTAASRLGTASRTVCRPLSCTQHGSSDHSSPGSSIKVRPRGSASPATTFEPGTSRWQCVHAPGQQSGDGQDSRPASRALIFVSVASIHRQRLSPSIGHQAPGQELRRLAHHFDVGSLCGELGRCDRRARWASRISPSDRLVGGTSTRSGTPVAIPNGIAVAARQGAWGFAPRALPQ